MYISAPDGIIRIARLILPEAKGDALERQGFNSFGQREALRILQMLADLGWIEVSAGMDEIVHVRPTDAGLRIFQRGLTDDFLKEKGEIYRIITSLLTFGEDDDEYYQLHLDLANYHVKSGNYNRAMEIIGAIMKPLEQRSDRRRIAQAHILYGNCNLYRSECSFAEIHFRKALEISEGSENHDLMARALQGIAICRSTQEDFSSALEYFRRARDEFERAGDSEGAHTADLNIAYLYSYIGKIDKFYEYNNRAEEYFLETGNEERRLQAIINEASVRISVGDYEIARSICLEAIRISRDIGNIRWEILSKVNLAHSYIFTGEPGKALDLIREIGEYYRKNLNFEGMAIYEELSALYMISVDRLDLAKEHISSLERLCEKRRMGAILRDAYAYITRALSIYNYKDNTILELQSKFIRNLTEQFPELSR
ncbi:hypothetical protein GCM10007108_04210 [Thermogymnomonas acidicola]|uniref:Tetratricopeptide repeat protein n=1 Tax=Thermogymnomonas acidicola TaxID=399579 RepID=A0AA37BQ72_9ARCH|nr:tetratricopeptide repeat protein [Thermogymnomonas acidicola]GGM69299.1 hypothetical protein GCM10007108_04210 [Thermogymnomonas acidicola]